MQMKIVKFIGYLFFFLSTLTASAQDENKDSTSRVEVSSQKGLELKSYSQMQKGLKAYTEYNKLAPNSELFFILIPRSKKLSLEGVTMRLASDETSINIPIDADGNPCTKTISVYFFAPDGMNTVTLDTPKLKSVYKVNEKRQYTLPLSNADIIDDDILQYTSNIASTVK